MKQQYKCTKHKQVVLRASYTYPDMLWCDQCKTGWLPSELENPKNKQILIKNISDRCRNPDYPVIFLSLSNQDLDQLKKLKKEREKLIENYPSQLKHLKFTSTSFLSNAHCLERIKLKQEDQNKEESLSNSVIKNTLLIVDLDIDLKKSRSQTVEERSCNLILSSTGISFENNNEDDYSYIESAIVLWKDLGII